MASKRRRRGRPRKTGHRYPSGNLRATNEPAISPAAVAATQPHRKGLGDHAADQLAESQLGRMAFVGRSPNSNISPGKPTGGSGGPT